MNRVYNKTELLSCATSLSAGTTDVMGTIAWALNNISEMAEDNVKMLAKWTNYFTKKGIKPSYVISKEAELECIKLYNQYKVEMASYEKYEQATSKRASMLVAMMNRMNNA